MEQNKIVSKQNIYLIIIFLVFILSVKSFSAEDYPIGVWFYNENYCTSQQSKLNIYEINNLMHKEFKDLKKHGVNFAILNWLPDNLVPSALDIAKDEKIRCIVHLTEVDKYIQKSIGNNRIETENILNSARDEIKDIKTHPALFGYYITDEPSYSLSSVKTLKVA